MRSNFLCILYRIHVNSLLTSTQSDLVFGSDLGFHSQMLTFGRNIASDKKSAETPYQYAEIPKQKHPKQKHSLLQW